MDMPESGAEPAPEGMVAVRPVLPGMFNSIPRNASERQNTTRVYDHDTTTNRKLLKEIRLPEGSTVWLIAKSEIDDTYVRKSYAVYNPEHDEHMSYLVPCVVDDEGREISMEGTPLYLKDGATYLFYAVSPARKLDEEKFKTGQVAFKVHNGEYFYANDCRYEKTTPKEVTVSNNNSEAVYEIKLSPMMNQTAELKFQITKGEGVHNLDIQPAGIQISGLQNDSIDYTPSGISWHMSQASDDQPIALQHGNKIGTYNNYDYTIDADSNINIEVPVLPMYSLSKPIIVVFRLKVNGVPSSYEMMLNEKDLKAGYSYGYRGKISINQGVDVITWQYVSWETNVDFPFE